MLLDLNQTIFLEGI